MSEERAVRFGVDGDVGTITIDIPSEKVNVLRSSVVDELSAAIDAAGDAQGLRCVFVKSGKPDCFVAGADLKEIVQIVDPDEAKEKSRIGQVIMSKLESLEVPTIALINGTCLGGGLELALACDYRVATDHEKTSLGLPETSLGIVPGFGGTYRLPATVGMSQALRMILTGKPIDGKTAVKRGLADAFYPVAFHEEWALRTFLPRIESRAGRRRIRRQRKRKPVSVKLSENNPLGRSILFRSSRKRTLAKTGGNYPAPLRAMRLLKAVPRSRAQAAYRREREAIADLIPSPIAKNLMGLFLSREAAKSRTREDEGSRVRPIRHAVVLGAGVMGGRISWLFSHKAIPVVMKDIYAEAVRTGYQSAHSVYEILQKKGKYSPREVLLGMHKVHGTTSYDDIGAPDVVIEAVVENRDVKHSVLSEAESRVDDETIIATNTSSLTVGELSRSLSHTERFGGMHFFNPANRMPLVEVVAGEETSQATVRALASLAVTLGKVPVVVKDCPGFLVNRLLMPYLNEALLMAEEGQDLVRVDRIIEDFGMPMGPFRLLDEVGLDVAADVAESLIEGYGERMQAGESLPRLREHDNLLGRKAGAGFYRYHSPGGAVAGPNPAARKILRNGSSSGGSSSAGTQDAVEVVQRPLFAMLNEAARALEEGIVRDAEQLDLALVLGIGFAPFRGGICSYADAVGPSSVRDTLERYAEKHGERFSPAPLIRRHAEEGSHLRS